MSRTHDNHIKVSVVAEYIPEQSNVREKRFVFAYHVTIANDGLKSAQLMSRHWIITDGNHHIQEVKGDGVIGEQPVIDPGESYRYSSGTVLETPHGNMRGTYQMVSEDGERFNAAIPAFTLSPPHSLH